MPTYQYRGIECDHVFEVRQSFSDDPVATCEICGKPVRRVIHASPVVFKGTGWYITDSRPTSDPIGGVQDPAKKSDSEPATAEKKSDKSEKSESKPAESSKPASAPASAD